ncbi:MAG: glycoside hydrolase family 95 protein [Tannerellaceae bacterium]|jgi:alpha-L-fucosidase 2|nr:glycoside hydrolase family 95 protein [Tannerellaceae bacterium]
MRNRKFVFTTLVCVAAAFLFAGNAQDGRSLWYGVPAEVWEEALPVGNGRLGAMIFGGVNHEKLQMNDVTVWSGGVEKNADIPDAYKHLPEIREALKNKDFKLAEELSLKYMICKKPEGFDGNGFNNIYFPSYQTLGNLDIYFNMPQGAVSGYKRWLDIENALAGVSFNIGEASYSREFFSSHADSAIVVRLTAAGENAKLNFSIALDRQYSAKTTARGSSVLIMKGNTDYKDRKGNCDYEVQLKVLAKDGKVQSEGNRLTVKNATEAYIYLVCGTSYLLDYDRNYRQPLLSEKLAKVLAAASSKVYDRLRKEHIEDYRSLFNRMDLQLGETSKRNLPTDERLKAFGNGEEDADLAALFYQYGRYLLISSSRENNPLPSNSQGIWGDGFDLPWHCDYKSNINYQMNYWCVEASNLSECHTSALRFNASMVKPGQKTAQSYFNAPGWVLAMQTNVWGWTSPGWNTGWGNFFGGSGWLMQNYWEHYAYTQDKKFLREYYPVMKSAAEFYLGAMSKNDSGYWVMSPSSSPENRYHDINTPVIRTGGISVTEGGTMEMSIIRDLFDNVIASSEILGIDQDFRNKLQQTRAQLLPFRVGRAGQLQEWADDVDLLSIDIRHRHVSHLFALHPGKQISPITTPELAQAAQRTLEIRGDDGTGWSLAWKINFWARLLDGDRAYKLMTYQLRHVSPDGKTSYGAGGGTYPNLFDAHPPFQIDGNFGFVSGLNEMLLQSHRTYVDPAHPGEVYFIADLLPAIPNIWRSGKINGLRSRGGFEFNLEWAEGKLVRAEVKNIFGNRLKVVYHGKEVELNMQKGEKKELRF